MSTDYAAKEREFLDSLEADTGRDLAGWMRAIDESGQPTRNDIIDWLRLQGFLFARASWLERIHNNKGVPLYGEKPVGRQVLPPRRARNRERPAPLPPAAAEDGAAAVAATATAIPPPPAVTDAPRVVPVPVLAADAPPSPAPVAATPASSASAAGGETVDDVIARAKAFRPLAQYLLRQVEKAVPGTCIGIQNGLVMLGRPVVYALIAVSPRDLRLLVDLGDGPAPPNLVPARVAGADERFQHMLVLTDARQLDAGLTSLLRAADANVNSRSAAAAG